MVTMVTGVVLVCGKVNEKSVVPVQSSGII